MLTSRKGLKIRTLDIENRHSAFGCRFMWERNIPLSAIVAIDREAYYQFRPSMENKVDGFEGWQLMKHIPLQKPGNVLYGLTVYCATEGGITGLESHFRSSTGLVSVSRAGHTEGCAIYFGLAGEEYFDTAWILCDEDTFIWGPFLMVRITPFSCYHAIDFLRSFTLATTEWLTSDQC